MFNSIFDMYSNHAPTLLGGLNTSAHNPSALQNQSGMANAAYNANQAAFGQMSAQQHAAAAWQRHMQSAVYQKPKRFMIDGVLMDLEEFLDSLYPDDCAEKTFLALKLTKGNEDDNT